MNVEAQITLDQFSFRHYQVPIDKALQSGKRRIIAIMPRRSGKDFLSWNIIIREAIKKPGIYWVVLPTSVMARKIYWDGRTNDGKPWLSCIPKDLIKSIHQQEMKIILVNNSVIQLQGSEDPDRLVGANCYGVILSEYALINPLVYDQIISPMLTANSGFALFLSTPRGKQNHLWDIWNRAQNNPIWFAYSQTIEDTRHIPLAEIQRQIDAGEIEEGLARQEYWVDWNRGLSGVFYGSYLDIARMQNRIGPVPHEPGLLTYTAWDIGVSDHTAIIWFQIAGATVRIINCYSNHSVGLDTYVDIINEQQKKWGYKYAKHFAPFDIKVREWGAGAITRYEQARQLGITFTPLEQIGLHEGINNAWMNFNKLYFDETNCKSLLDALNNYRREWDEIKKTHNNKPIHNWTSHYCFTADTKILTRFGMRSIIDIEENDEVLTLYGWQKCTKSFLVKTNAELVEVKFKDGTKVRCTPDHMFLTETGWISAEKLTPNLEIQSSLMNSLNISTEKFTEFISTKNISPLPLNKIYTVKYGKMLSVIFQKIVTFIMLMEIHLIILYITCNVYLRQSIEKFLNLITWVSEINAEKAQFAGMDLKKEKIGIDIMQEDLNLENIINVQLNNANGAKKKLMLWLDSGNAHKNTAIPIVRPLRVENVVKLNYLEDVYCITVPNAGHFSLENGAIVKNCDAFRYLVQSLPLCNFKSTTPQDLENRFKEAKLGNSSEPTFRQHRY